MTFQDYLTKLPTKETRILCYLSRGVYYTPDFPEVDFGSYTLESYSDDTILRCFVKIDGDLLLEIEDKLRGTTLSFAGILPVIRVDLTISLAAEKPLPVAEILDIHAYDWISHLKE